MFEVDFTRVDEIREAKKAEYERAGRASSPTCRSSSKAAVDALRAVPVVNASVDGDNIVYHKDINIGIAVALDWGLIVPVIKNADEKNLLGSEPRDRRPRRARARQAAEAGRGAGRHVHDHQPRRVRRAVRHADHQPAAGGDPRRRRRREAAGRDRRRDRDPADGATCRSATTTASSTARSPTSSCRTSSDARELGRRRRLSVRARRASTRARPARSPIRLTCRCAPRRPAPRPVPYAEALALQRALVEERRAGRVGDLLLLLEHPPVLTLGVSGDGGRSHILATADALAARGIEVLRDRPRRRRHLPRPRPDRRLSDPRPEARPLRRAPLRARPRRGADPRRRPTSASSADARARADRRLGRDGEAGGDRRAHLALGHEPRLRVQRDDRSATTSS